MNSAVKVLLVDDEARNLDVLESFLQSADYTLVRALTAEQALLLLLEGEFAVIVLDIQMPDMNGIELANLIKQRKRTQHIPVIFLTAYFQEDDVLVGYNIGAVDYLTKPVNPPILKSKIAVFVDLFRKTKALVDANAALELEVAHRLKVEETLHLANTALEERVAERTVDLLSARDKAVAASRAKDDFLATLSHELRTPLNPVLLIATERARNFELSPEIRDDFETIAKNVALEARLIDDLLDMTRIVRGKFALEMKLLDVHESLRYAIEMSRADIEQKKITLSMKFDSESRMVLGDDVRLKQVFWNVIKNAVKFTPEAGEITIESVINSDASALVVSVTDTGIGVLPDELAKIFEAFTQGDHALEGPHRFGGMGLGLAISRMIMEMHSGSIAATSAGRDQGTTFLIKLPVPLEGASLDAPDGIPSSEQTQHDSAHSQVVIQPYRILLVEDHDPTSRALAQLLIRRNYSVTTASSIADARLLARSQKYDLLVSDIGLPDGKGYELMTELQGKLGLTGIALSGYGMEEDVEKSRAAGFVAHLTKPVSVQALDNALIAASRVIAISRDKTDSA